MSKAGRPYRKAKRLLRIANIREKFNEAFVNFAVTGSVMIELPDNLTEGETESPGKYSWPEPAKTPYKVKFPDK